MIKNIDRLFFDIGSTLVDEHKVYEDRYRKMAEEANTSYDKISEIALNFYKQNQKGDIEAAKLLGIKVPKWNHEYEVLYADTTECLEFLSETYKIGVIANQSLGTEKRLERYGLMRYIDLVVASAEEGVPSPIKEYLRLP